MLSFFPNAKLQDDSPNTWIILASHDISYRIQFYESFISIQVYFADPTCKLRRCPVLYDYLEDVRRSHNIFASKEKKDEHEWARTIDVGLKWNIDRARNYQEMESLFFVRLSEMKYDFPQKFIQWRMKLTS